MFNFEDCGKNCFNCENGKTKKDRENCEYHKKRANYWRRMAYKAKKEYLKNNQAN